MGKLTLPSHRGRGTLTKKCGNQSQPLHSCKEIVYAKQQSIPFCNVIVNFAAKIRNIRVLKEVGCFWIVFDEEKEDDTEGVWLELKFKFLGSKDCAGLFALMMTFGQGDSPDIP